VIALAVSSSDGVLAPLAYPVGALYLVVAVLAWRAGTQRLAVWAWTAWSLTMVGFIAGILAAGLVSDLFDLDLWPVGLWCAGTSCAGGLGRAPVDSGTVQQI